MLLSNVRKTAKIISPCCAITCRVWSRLLCIQCLLPQPPLQRLINCEDFFLQHHEVALLLSLFPDPVRLVKGINLCSGRLEVKSNKLWSSVCEDDFHQRDAEVVCRELGCGAPSVFKGGLYGEAEAPVWKRKFHCGGHESALLECGSSQLARETCSPGKAVGLTCSGRAAALIWVSFSIISSQLLSFPNHSLAFVQALMMSDWWEELAVALVDWSWNTMKTGKQWIAKPLPGTWR